MRELSSGIGECSSLKRLELDVGFDISAHFTYRWIPSPYLDYYTEVYPQLKRLTKLEEVILWNPDNRIQNNRDPDECRRCEMAPLPLFLLCRCRRLHTLIIDEGEFGSKTLEGGDSWTTENSNYYFKRLSKALVHHPSLRTFKLLHLNDAMSNKLLIQFPKCLSRFMRCGMKLEEFEMNGKMFELSNFGEFEGRYYQTCKHICALNRATRLFDEEESSAETVILAYEKLPRPTLSNNPESRLLRTKRSFYVGILQ